MSLPEKVELLWRRANETDDAEAFAQLEDLIAEDEQAFRAYVDLMWMESHLPFANSLVKLGCDAGQPVASEALSRPAGESKAAWSGTLVAIAAVVLALLTLTAILSSGDGEDAGSVAQSVPLEVGAKDESLAGDGAEPERKVAFSNLAHPPKVGGVSGGVLVDEEPVPETISFNFHVRSILSENCFYCHGPDPNHREADLRLDTEEGLLNAVEPESPEDSELIARIFSDDQDMQMPPHYSGRSLTRRQKAILSRWVEQGAKFEQHWAFMAPQKPAIPDVKNGDWAKNPIDRFVLAKLESKSIKPSPRAKATVIVRRLHLDLIGIPPRPEQSRAFVTAYQADADKAIDELVDRLLASEHFGERMAMPWLDVARYSDSNGFQQDGDRSQWPWRDWVVRAFNANMPFDQFTIEQLAGDLLEKPTQDQLIATGFNRNHMLNGEGGAIAEEQRNNYVFDRVDATATTWLGLTMACAQCHDHKYDPITQEDYYKFFAYFNNVDEKGNVDRKVGRQQCAKPYIQMPTDSQSDELKRIDGKIAPLNRELADSDQEITKAMRRWEIEAREATPESMGRDLFNILVKDLSERSKGEDNRLKGWFLEHAASQRWRDLKKQQVRLQGARRRVQEQILTVMVMRERKQPRETFVLQRGNYETRGRQVTTGVPSFLPRGNVDEGSTRLDLARWLVSEENPLTSRVVVNRFWQLFFGIGIVKTAEDFGVQAELPSHRQLLDWLAVEFRESGWDVKQLVRKIVTSETYLQTSKFRKDLAEIDPENRLLARSPRYRLPSMLIRDSALLVSGLLNAEVGGKPVYPWQPDRLWKEFSLEKFGYRPSQGNDRYRRGLYTFWRRTVPPPNMFDSANRQTCTVKQARTNTPLHALTLLNDPTFVETACFLAADVMANGGEGAAARSWVQDAFARAVGRDASQSELESLVRAFDQSHDFYESAPEQAKAFLAVADAVAIPADGEKLSNLAALASACQVIMNTDEFMTRE